MITESGGKLVDRNASTLGHWMPIWVANAMRNYEVISREAKNRYHNMRWGVGTYDSLCVSSLPKQPLRPAIICGSGPSLDDVLPYMKDFPGVIFAGASNLKAVAASGRDPDYVIALDSNERATPQLEIPGKEWPNTTLVTHPSIEPKILKLWRWHRKFFRPLQMRHDFFENIYPLMYPFIEVSFLNAGCTVNTELELANYLGCWPIIIAGVDFGWPDGRGRCARYEWEEGAWVKKPDGPITTQYTPHISNDGKCVTTEEMIAYKQNFFLVARTDIAQIYSCSRGIIRPDEVLGYVQPDQLNEFCKHPPEYVDPKTVAQLYEKNLDAMGICMEDMGDGTLQVKSKPGKEKTAPKGSIAFIGKGATFGQKGRMQLREVDGVQTVEKKA